MARSTARTVTPKMGRRRFMLGSGAAGLLAACGNGGGEEPAAAPQMVSLFSTDRVLAAGMPQRIPFGVVDVGDLSLAETAELPVTVLHEGETVEQLTVQGRIVEHDHGPDVDPDHQHADLLRYYALRAELPEPGVYDLEIDFGGGAIGSLPVQAFDPAEIDVVMAGDQMPALATPTVDEPEGIDPICTRDPVCGLHGVSLDSALAEGQPLALLVATPALCQTAYCGPVLETLLDQQADFEQVRMLHLEVYANAADVDGNYQDPSLRVAAPVEELGLTFEPSLFLVDATGTVVDRIDNLFDASELRAALQTLV